MKTRSHDPKKEPKISSAQAKSQFQPRPFSVQAKPQVQETPDLHTQLESAQRFGHNFANISIQNPGNPILSRIQPKLTIGASGDKYEQEADKTAAEIVQRLHGPEPSYGRDLSQPESEFVQRMIVSTVQNSNSIHQQGIPNRENRLMKKLDVSALQREVMPEEEKELQMKPTLQRQSGEGGMSASPDLEATIQQARGKRQPLAQSIREPMEQAFGVDFSGVNVHTDAQSDQMNQSIQAKAFTTGQDIFFRQGAYEPGNRGGQELIAHELTHVVQQGSDVLRKEASLIQRKLKETGKKYKVCGPLTAISSQSWEGFLTENDIENRFFPADKPALLTLYQDTKTKSEAHEKSKGATTGNALSKVYNQLLLEAKEKSVSPGGIHWNTLLTAALDVIQPQPSGKYIKQNATDAANKVWPIDVLKETVPEDFWKAVLKEAKPKPVAAAPKVIPSNVDNILKHAQTRYMAWVSGAESNRGAWAGSDQHGEKPNDYESVTSSVILALDNALPHNGWRLTKNSLSAEEQNSLHKYGGSAKGQDFIYHL